MITKKTVRTSLKMIVVVAVCAAAHAALGEFARGGVRAAPLDAMAWECSEWISAKDAPVFDGKVVDGGTRAADGTSWFAFALTNVSEVVSAKWMTAGLGVYEVYVNGRAVGDDYLKPGFTHNSKTKYSFTYDVAGLLDASEGGVNVFAAEVSSGWWRDKICTSPNDGGGFFGRKSAFRGVIELVFADGSRRLYGTDEKTWKAGTSGPVTHAGIYDGEEYDARCKSPLEDVGMLGEAERNDEFKGRLIPSDGAEVCLRRDLAMAPLEAYVWSEVTGVDGTNAFGKVVKSRFYADGSKMKISKGENLVLDFGQNAAAVPEFRFSAGDGTVLTALPAEMLNDGNGAKRRGNDGPEGSVYRVNLRSGYENSRLVKYTFFGRGEERYIPRFTYFGYRYLSLSATGDVEIEKVRSVPVTSIRKDMEIGCIETGFAPLNRFIANVRWGQLSNYLSVPTDCPQRDERLGWTADTQVFCEAGSFNADTLSFFAKWMRDVQDSQHEKGGFPGVAPFTHRCGEFMRHGWSDAGVVVPYVMWLQFGSTSIVDDNWDAMVRFLERVAETKYRTEKLPECGMYQWNDWLSLTKYESCPYRPEFSAFAEGPDGSMHPTPEALKYWDYLGGCHWLADARMMATMAEATDRVMDAEKYRLMAAEAEAYLRQTFFATSDGRIAEFLRDMQTPMLFALRLGLVGGVARERTLADLKASIVNCGGTLHTGFLGTAISLDTLTANGLSDLAYDLMLNRRFPGWLYSVDQGATTVWERWNGYTKDKGFGPVDMNSFNHYAYGCVLAWIYKTVAGVAADPKAPGYRNIIMAPKPDRRLGYVKAEYKSAAGLVKSAWRYEGDAWIWDFTVPAGATASVVLPDGRHAITYLAGPHHVKCILPQKGVK